MVPPVNITVMEVMNAKEPPPGSASPAASGQDHHPSVPVSESRGVSRVDILIRATLEEERQKQPKRVNLKDCNSSRCCYLCWNEGKAVL